jgi:pimeloyl-ACP methyl ester carboxylesterase
MELAAQNFRAIAIDLPGIGESIGPATNGSKSHLADIVHQLISIMGLKNLTLVGQDVGGMIVYSYLRTYQDIKLGVIMDVVIPGIDPWEAVRRNPYIWHFALHSIPFLPERLVQGRQDDYFDFFYNELSADPQKITTEARAAYVKAYSSDSALTAGFNWYRTFQKDADENKRASDLKKTLATPILYMRGDHESGSIDDYIQGMRAAGATSIEQSMVKNSGHFTQEEAPEETWRLISART